MQDSVFWKVLEYSSRILLEGARHGACVCEQRGRADEEKGGWQKIRGGHVARPLGVRGQQAESPLSSMPLALNPLIQCIMIL